MKGFNMKMEDLIQLKAKIEEQYNQAIQAAKDQRSKKLKAIDTVLSMLKAASSPTIKPITQNSIEKIPLSQEDEDKVYGALTAKVKEAIEGVPEIWNKNDILRIIGQTDEGSLAGCFYRLLNQKYIEKVEQGKGRRPTTYRKLKRKLFE